MEISGSVTPFILILEDRYKICLRVHANGYGSGVGTHVSVFVCLMHGEHDKNLVWPFNGKVTVQLINQKRGEGHIEKAVLFDDDTPLECASKVIEGERAPKGWGSRKFVPNTTLYYDEFWNTEHLRNDCLEFRITEVKLSKTAEELSTVIHDQQNGDTIGAEQPELQPLPPVNFVMKNFISHKLRDTAWQSPFFYSHIRGYKMCLSVRANGKGDGYGTHVSVAVHLMHGDCDDSLVWPFRGDIEVQLVNQKRNEAHIETVILFGEDPHDSERTQRRGYFKFIPHSFLHLDELWNTEYLKNDCLEFRIVKVNLSQSIAAVVHNYVPKQRGSKSRTTTSIFSCRSHSYL